MIVHPHANTMKRILAYLCLTAGAALCHALLIAQPPGPQPGPPAAPGGPPQAGGAQPAFPPHTKVFEGYEEVISTADGKPSFMSIWVRQKDGQMLAALPKDFARKKFYIALTVASGETYAGLQAGEIYAYWRQYDDRIALVEPNLRIRSTGDPESKKSVERLFTDRVLLDVPILTMLPKWGPVIDMDELLVGQAFRFFGGTLRGVNSKLISIKTAKAFPGNVEIAYEVPMANGILKTLHYSISFIPENTQYKPRPADNRVGYFTTSYRDLGKSRDDEVQVRYINRWQLEKADPSLTLSPPKNPIVFYIEHTTPIRYRRWVRDGILMWNKAFEKVGLVNAIEVYYQDSRTGQHMDLDPEDRRYNFVRWLNNDVGTAIGPSRVDPNTGQILDADIILTDGWIRHYWSQFNEMLPSLAVEGFHPETLAWLQSRPQWDPRVRLAAPSERNRLAQESIAKGIEPHGGHALAHADSGLLGDEEFDGLVGQISQVNGFCRAADVKALDMAMMRMMLEIAPFIEGEEEGGEGEEVADKDGDKEKDKKEKEKVSMLDGIPEWFVGPLIAELVAHEVGHTLGLRHNFKASSIYTIDEINSDELKGKKPFAGSVMDYLPVNVYMSNREKQGDYAMIDIGPYDMWAIEYGYSFANTPAELKPILDRVAEESLPFATDEDTYGPDPLARRYDFGKDPLTYARSQIALSDYHRERILDKFVKDGDSWAKARKGYEMTLSLQLRSISMMANWLGGSYVNRAFKGDPGAAGPLEVVDAQTQREAMNFVIRNAFYDKAFGLTPELLSKMTTEKWLDEDSWWAAMQDSTWPVHDRIMGIQASILTMLMNPTTLARIYDNEFRTPAEVDMITLPELFDTIRNSVWSELESPEAKRYTARQPLISSLRRNLQREFLDRMVDLTKPDDFLGAAGRPVSNLALMHLRGLYGDINTLLKGDQVEADAYSRSHLEEAALRIQKVLDAQFIYNTNDIRGGGGSIMILLGKDGEVIQP